MRVKTGNVIELWRISYWRTCIFMQCTEWWH